MYIHHVKITISNEDLLFNILKSSKILQTMEFFNSCDTSNHYFKIKYLVRVCYYLIFHIILSDLKDERFQDISHFCLPSFYSSNGSPNSAHLALIWLTQIPASSDVISVTLGALFGSTVAHEIPELPKKDPV